MKHARQMKPLEHPGQSYAFPAPQKKEIEPMTERKKNGIRKKLLAKLDDLASRAKRNELIKERCNDPMDQMQNRFDLDLTISVINKDWQTKKAVETALKSLDEDEYGICRDCGETINPKRLEAIAWTTLCIHCQEYYDGLDISQEMDFRRAA